jgi:uncharacterized protein YabN with tetrapyrrole methylase and pyrophosphatase domain
MRAQKLVKRADRAGVTLGGVQELTEGIAEKARAIGAVGEDGDESGRAKAVQLLGQLMFECAALARELDADAEETLTDENNTFIGRFREAEEKARQNESEIRL